MKQTNWTQIKETLIANFIEQDFRPFSTFSTLDFDKGLEIFRYILNQKLANHDETKAVLIALQSYASGELNKELLEKLVSKFEPFTKKILELIGLPFIPNPRKNGAPALSWCFTKLFTKLPSVIEQKKISDFYSKTLDDKIERPNFKSEHFSSDFLTDDTPHGKSLHNAYHFRNSNIHNDSAIKSRDVSNLIDDFIISYLYFTFKFYKDLCITISDDDLQITYNLEIRNLSSLAGGAYNPDIENEVSREGITQTIGNILKKVDVLFLEGSEGVGKTTILHQFIAKNPNSCFTHFIDGSDKNTYNTLTILQSFCNQIHFYLKGSELSEEISTSQMLDESFLKNYFHSSKLKTKLDQYLFFIIDGLDEVNEDGQLEIKEQILDLIPSNRENIKIILTGRIGSNIISDKIKSENWETPSLSSAESKIIFGKSIPSQDFIEINKICENNAGKLVFIRELIKNSNITVSNIIDNISYDINDLFTYLWHEFYDKDDELQGLVLGILAFEGKKYSIGKIAKILSKPEKVITEEQIKIILSKFPFIRRNQRGTYEFIFEDLTDFARKRLFKYKKIIDGVIIEYLLSNFDSKDALINLPELYKETGKIDDLVKLLGGARWKQLLEKSESISDVSRVSTIALQSIQNNTENKYIPIILKYSVLKSALKELNQMSVWQYEIAANLSLNDDINAINLANLAFLKEDRLKLFASIAKTYTQKKKEVPPSIIKAIQELYEEINFKNIGNIALELASLLMYSSPKLAFQLIEELSGSISDNDNAFDWALAQISLNAYANLKDSEDISKEDVNTKVYSRIRNPKIKEFSDAIMYLSENQKYEEIIIKINELESTSQKLFLIKNWILNNKEDLNIGDVIELGIDLVINKSDKYIPKANDFKIFAEPLPYIKNKDKTYDLIGKIELYIKSIESSSGTNDLLNIKLLIAQALCNFDFKVGEEKLTLIYYEISRISDLSLKATCLAIYAGAAKKIKNKYPEKEVEIYADLALENIESSIDSILNQTAEHFEIVQGIITNLIKIYPEPILNICKKLNTSIVRDNAFLESLATYLKQDIEDIKVEILNVLLDSIIDLDIRKIALNEIINRLNLLNKKSGLKNKFSVYFNRIDEIFDNELKCFLYVKLISILEKEEEDISGISNKLKETWKELETSANKIELGFEVAYRASFLENKELARDFLNLARKEKEKPELLLDSPNTAQVFYMSIELVIRLFSGLIYKNCYNEKDIIDLETIISSLPSEKQQIQLWTTLVLRIASKSEESLPKKIINSYILPKLSKIKNKNERIEIIFEIAPLLYLEDSNLTILNELPTQKLKDIALSKVCKYLYTKCLPDDLCDDNDEGFPIDFETLKKILDLVKRMSNDYIISWQIDELRKSIISKNTMISSQQVLGVKKQIEEIAEEKFPDINNIKHDGYKILIKAYAISIQNHPKLQEWNSILSEVENIPNLSDKIFMWISIASLITNRQEYGTLKQDLIEKASNQSYNLPSFIDTVGKVSMIFMKLTSKKIVGIDLKTLMSDFFDIQKQKDVNPKLREKYRNILDVAYATDPTIAKVFITSFDKDPARKNTGAYLNNHLNYLEFQSKIDDKINSTKSEQELIEENPRYFNKIIDKKLSRLNAIKTSKDKLSPKDLIYQLDIASQKSIYESYNVFTYFIERFVVKYENTDESEKLIKKSYLELLEVCNLIKLLSIRNSDKIKSLFDIISSNKLIDESEELLIVKQDLGEEIYENILKLLNRGFSDNEVSNILKISLDKVELIAKNI